MAGPFYVDDGGDGSTESSWATADTSINALDTEYTFASGEIVYFGHDHICQATNSASLTITGPASGVPVYFISATQGSDPVTYAKSSSAQIDTTEATTYDIAFDGSFAIYGMKVVAGRSFLIYNDLDEYFFARDSTFVFGPAGNMQMSAGKKILVDCAFDLTADGTTARTGSVFYLTNIQSQLEIIDATFTNAGYRTGTIFDTNTTAGHNVFCSGCDFSGFANATLCEFVNRTVAGCRFTFNNCLTAATWAPQSSPTAGDSSIVECYNCGPADAPTYLYYNNEGGQVVSTAAIYRTGGATVEGEACSWLVTTYANYPSEGSPFYTPWIYGTVDSTGSKTFTLYITNGTADFTDAEVWLVIESLTTSDEAISGLATDQRATILTTAAAQTDDTTSTWNGTGPSFTYKQSLAVTATVNETGMFRARVAVAVAGIASSRYFYVDPKVTVS